MKGMYFGDLVMYLVNIDFVRVLGFVLGIGEMKFLFVEFRVYLGEINSRLDNRFFVDCYVAMSIVLYFDFLDGGS